MKTILILICFFIIVILAWHLWGVRMSNVEKPKTDSLKTYGNIDIVRFPASIIAKTTTPGSLTDAPYTAFGMLAGYIFGNNRAKDKIAMTAPVTTQKVTSETIAMTAPVTSTADDAGMVVTTFTMPEGWTMENLPIPNDTRVELIQTSEITRAVWQFGGYAQQGRVEKQRTMFQEALKENSINWSGNMTLAQYNDPRTPPRLRKNELWVELSQ